MQSECTGDEVSACVCVCVRHSGVKALVATSSPPDLMGAYRVGMRSHGLSLGGGGRCELEVVLAGYMYCSMTTSNDLR